MDDELELNISAPAPRRAPPKPKPASAPRKDGAPAARPAGSTPAVAPGRPAIHQAAGKPAPARQPVGKGGNGGGAGAGAARPPPAAKPPPTAGPGKRPDRGDKQQQAPQRQKQQQQQPQQPQQPQQRGGNGEGPRGRVKQQAGKERYKRAAGYSDPDDPDELLRAEEPGDEADDVAAAMAALAAREATLAAEGGGGGGGGGAAAEREGVVEFDDDGGDARGGGGGGDFKRRRLDGQQRPAIKATGRGNFTPGSLTRAAAAPPAAAAAAAAGAPAGAASGVKKRAGAAAADGGKSDAAANAAAAAAAAAPWTELGLAAPLAAQLATLGFVSPTPIQREVLPVLLAGRDALVKAQTGSGKTLCYLLPALHDLQARQPRVSRSEGTHAIVIAPTRELCLQVFDVASALLRRFHWLVAGLLIGGEHRGHEKARLRKGVTLLAATPGRLLDHLQSTAAFRTASLRWLVLDEADRLLDLGFEAKLRSITELLNTRAGLPSSSAAAGAEGGASEGGEEAEAEEEEEEAGGLGDMEEDWDWDARPRSAAAAGTSGRGRSGREGGQRGAGGAADGGGGAAAGGGGGGGGGGGEGSGAARRRTVLLSATLHKQLGALAELSLQDPAVLGFEASKQAGARGGDASAGADEDGPDAPSRYSLPASLRQRWVEVAAKDRLMTLAALLRSRAARRRAGGTRAVVFIASCAGVEWHHSLLAPGGLWEAVAGAPLLPRGVALLKLHGDMPQAQRTEAFAAFSKEGDGVLLCTDVAARGLDFPHVSTIVQYDVPGAPSEYVHRVGRSARMGAAGEALMFLMPHEVPYASLLRSRGVLLEQEPADGLARWLPTPPLDGPGGGPPPGSKRARLAAKAAAEGGGGGGSGAGGGGGGGAARQLAAQLHRMLITAVEREPQALAMAQDAFRSYVRAYATHTGDVKRVFAVRNLHLGHVAHAFCLAARPTMVGSSGATADRKQRKRAAAAAGEAERLRKMKRAARRASAVTA